ncbi:MAG: DUF411 domain-containing protein [Oxalobacteraceae bacterium]
MQRRTVLQSLLAAVAVAHLPAQAALPVVEVYKTPSCGCCHLWVEHLRANGFSVNAHDVDDTTGYRQKFGVPQALGSCHTGVVGGYALEGHVPAREIKRLLAERPKIKGLAVPAMVQGSPGMEGPRSDPYDVLAFRADGSRSVYQHYNGSTK